MQTTHCIISGSFEVSCYYRGGGGELTPGARWKVKKKEPWTKGGKGDSGRRDGVEMKGESKRRERGEGRGRKR